MRTSSAWGHPPSRYYGFLRTLELLPRRQCNHTLGVLGCADGKFVLPAVRRGIDVLAVDRDPIALFGGPKPGIGGEVTIKGLVKRLLEEKLSDKAVVVCANFLEIEPRRCLGVWVSGAIQYSANVAYSAESIIGKIMTYVVPGGLLYVDYMLPYEDKYKGRPNCPEAAWWKQWASSVIDWQVLHHRVLPPIKDRAHIEYPVDHYHQWGHILLQRLR